MIIVTRINILFVHTVSIFYNDNWKKKFFIHFFQVPNAPKCDISHFIVIFCSLVGSLLALHGLIIVLIYFVFYFIRIKPIE